MEKPDEILWKRITKFGTKKSCESITQSLDKESKRWRWVRGQSPNNWAIEVPQTHYKHIIYDVGKQRKSLRKSIKSEYLTTRLCLKCHKPFTSEGPHNRLCQQCKLSNKLFGRFAGGVMQHKQKRTV